MAEPIAPWLNWFRFSVEWVHADSLHQGNKGNEEFCPAPFAVVWTMPTLISPWLPSAIVKPSPLSVLQLLGGPPLQAIRLKFLSAPAVSLREIMRAKASEA